MQSKHCVGHQITISNMVYVPCNCFFVKTQLKRKLIFVAVGITALLWLITMTDHYLVNTFLTLHSHTHPHPHTHTYTHTHTQTHSRTHTYTHTHTHTHTLTHTHILTHSRTHTYTHTHAHTHARTHTHKTVTILVA